MFTPQYGFDFEMTAVEWLRKFGATAIADLRGDDLQKMIDLGIITNGILDAEKLYLLSVDHVITDGVVDPLPESSIAVVDQRFAEMHTRPLPPGFGLGVDHPLWRKG
jgi:hypothetical protein